MSVRDAGAEHTAKAASPSPLESSQVSRADGMATWDKQASGEEQKWENEGEGSSGSNVHGLAVN